MLERIAWGGGIFAVSLSYEVHLCLTGQLGVGKLPASLSYKCTLLWGSSLCVLTYEAHTAVTAPRLQAACAPCGSGCHGRACCRC